MIEVIEKRTCDIDTEKPRPAETVSFTLDGQPYELELCARHKKEFNAMTARYADKARHPSQRKPARVRKRTHAQRAESAKIRQWATDHGIQVSVRGRIPDHVMARYRMAG